jgi:DNA-directed RNA polymerase subunit RPC12/RpoP
MSNLLHAGIRNTIKCPECGSLAKQELYSIAYAVHRPLTYDENGFLISSDSPNGYTVYQCHNCGKEYKDVE